MTHNEWVLLVFPLEVVSMTHNEWVLLGAVALLAYLARDVRNSRLQAQLSIPVEIEEDGAETPTWQTFNW